MPRRLPAMLTIGALWLGAPAVAAAAGTPADFDGDGYPDLAIGVPSDRVGTATAAGTVVVLRGSPAGLTVAGAQSWSQDSPGIANQAEAGDQFGGTLTAGDFDGDGFSDLVIGIPEEDLGSVADAGAVEVLRGSPSGLTAVGSTWWHQNVPGVPDATRSRERFGAALTAADFDGDGRADLAVGAFGDRAVLLFEGSPGGLTVTGARVLATPGRAVASGDFDGDDYADLASSAGTAGVAVRRGGPGGVDDAPVADLAMGAHSLAVGDFDADGFDDLAGGAPEDDRHVQEPEGSTGSAYVVRGSAAGLGGAAAIWDQGTPGIQGDPEPGEFVAFAVATGDIDGDGHDDLILGAPGRGGSVNVIRGGAGGPGGLTAAGDQFWTAASPGLRGPDGAALGVALATGDFNRDGPDDLAMYSPDSVLGVPDVGMVHVLKGTPHRLTAEGDQLWHAATPGVPGFPEAGERFGRVLNTPDAIQGCGLFCLGPPL